MNTANVGNTTELFVRNLRDTLLSFQYLETQKYKTTSLHMDILFSLVNEYLSTIYRQLDYYIFLIFRKFLNGELTLLTLEQHNVPSKSQRKFDLNILFNAS